MKINRPYVMVASVGSVKDAPMNNANQTAGWKTVTRKIKKGNAKKTHVQVSNPSKINQNTMKVFIETAAKNNEPELKEVNAPHKPRRVEVLKDQTSKKFPNSKLQEILDQGAAEMSAYDKPYNGSNVFKSTMKLKKEYLKTLKHLENQLKIYKLLLKFKISRSSR